MVQLVDIGDGHRLAPAPAAAYLRARAAGCPDGITSSYRDPVRQAAMRAQYEVELTAWRAGRGAKPTFVARVEDSEHVDGYALDLPVAPRIWMRAHPEYGFVFTDPTEAWHVAYRLDRDRHAGEVTSPAPITPTAPTEEDDKMIALARLKDMYRDGRVYVGDGITRTHVKTDQALKDKQSMIRLGVLKAKTDTVHQVDSLEWLGKEV